MKIVSFYNKETGLLHDKALMAGSERDIEINTPAGHVAVDGHHDALSKRVNVATGEIIDYQPPQPSPDHEWNGTTQRWQLSAIALDRTNRRTAAAARIRDLEAASVPAMRELLLSGGVAARQKLQAIEDEIVGIQASLGAEGS